MSLKAIRKQPIVADSFYGSEYYDEEFYFKKGDYFEDIDVVVSEKKYFFSSLKRISLKRLN